MWVTLDDDGHIMIGRITEVLNEVVIYVNDRMFLRCEHSIQPLTTEFIDRLKGEVINEWANNQ
ncbi:hypothetical protein B0I21_103267 [Sphingobacterium paludis]|uniref:Uncharacterized protein n=2 Tax=Sphingobacterium paludis TaxID=1476465 RepID=A0A4V3E1X1_9SPHI|nr:hypothetical protein B0I21_103267 [Sphingobacterium paludis]